MFKKLRDTEFSKVAAPFYIPTSRAWELEFLCQHLLISAFFILDIIVNGKWYLMVLMCIFLMTDVVYICITSICIVSLEKSLCRSFAYFKIKLLVCLLLSCKSSLYILDISPSLIRHMVCKNFLPFHGLSFHFFVCFTLKHESFKYWWSPVYEFFFCCSCFWCHI